MNIDKFTHMTYNLSSLNIIPLLFVLVGAINWGCIGLNDYNFVANVFGHYAKIVYILVGASGLYVFLLSLMQSLK